MKGDWNPSNYDEGVLPEYVNFPSSAPGGLYHHYRWRQRNTKKRYNILSIDFDYWYLADHYPVHCGRCHDVGEETDGLVNRGWEVDTATLTRDISIDHVKSLIPSGVPLYFCECHAEMEHILRRARHDNEDSHITVYNIDEHDDVFLSWPKTRSCHCGSWVDYSAQQSFLDEYRWIWNWRDYCSIDTDIHEVFVCKSSPYMSTEGDPHLFNFVMDLEELIGRKAEVFGYASSEILRDLNTARIRRARNAGLYR